MSEDNWAVPVFIVLILLSYALVYKAGTWKERKDYTALFAHEVETAYWQGWSDGQDKMIKDRVFIDSDSAGL